MINVHNLLRGIPLPKLKEFEGKLGLKNKPEQAWFSSAPQNAAGAAIADPARLRQALGSLDPEETAILRYAASLGGQFLESEILKKFPKIPSSLGRLKALFLLFDNPYHTGKDGLDWLCIPQEIAEALSLGMGEKSALGFLLDRQPSAWSSKAASALGLPPGSKVVVNLRIRQAFARDGFMAKVVSGLPEAARKLWKAIAAQEGFAAVEDLPALGYRHPAFGFSPHGTPVLSEPLQKLQERALLFPNRSDYPRFFIVPSDVLRAWQGPPKGTEPPAACAAPPILQSWGLRIISDLRLYAACLGGGRLRYTQKDYPEKRSLAAFLKALGIPEENYGLFLSQALEAFMGAQFKSAPDLLGPSPTEALRRLVGRWIESRQWRESSEVWRDARMDPNPYPASDASLPARRRVLLEALKRLPAETWVSFQDVARQAQAAGWNKAAFDDGSPGMESGRWYGSSPAFGRVGSLAILENMLKEALLWLGLVETGFTETQGKRRLTHVRLSAWGRFYLDHAAGEYPPLCAEPLEERFTFLPNLDIVAPPRLRADLLIRIFKMAELKGPHTFRLTKNSLREALDEGLTSEALLTFLESRSRTGLPETARQFIQELVGMHGHIKVGWAGTYLEVKDPLLLVELQSHKAFRDILRRTVGDRVAFLKESSADRVARLLKKLGYFPVVEKDGTLVRAGFS